ncbi:uncharacterized protein TNCV_4769101 [Trichonephila clavipes]|nr:uncharacterized protein TNCV_4769101 [Trichonephila clavipes]
MPAMIRYLNHWATAAPGQVLRSAGLKSHSAKRSYSQNVGGLRGILAISFSGAILSSRSDIIQEGSTEEPFTIIEHRQLQLDSKKDRNSCPASFTSPTKEKRLKWPKGLEVTGCQIWSLRSQSSGLLPIPVPVVAEWYGQRIVAGFVTSSSPVPLKTRRVGQRCMLNLSRAETSSRWCGVVVRRGGASSGVVHVT